MRKELIGIIGGVLAMVLGPLCAHAGKLEEWKKFRPLIVTAMGCEKGYVNTALARMNADQNPPYGADQVQRALAKRAAFWQNVSVETPTGEQACNDKLYDALSQYLSKNPHKSVEEVEVSFKSSMGNYLFGRWAVEQARLGNKDRLLTASAQQIQQRFTDLMNDLRFPAKEFGQDPQIQGEAAKDPLLKAWISWDTSAETGTPERDQIANTQSDLSENLHVNNVVVPDGTHYQRIGQVLRGNKFDKNLVAKVAPDVIHAIEISELAHGEAKRVVKADTYSVVFFQPIDFKVDECVHLVDAGSWTLYGDTISRDKMCDQFVKQTAWTTSFPVAVSPALAKILKPGKSNLNCLLNANYIALNNKDAQKDGILATFAKQKVYAKTVKSQADQNADGSTMVTNAAVSITNNYNQPVSGFLEACVPITLYDGYGPTKTLLMFLGIPLSHS